MSYQIAEEMIAKGKVMLNETFVGKSINDFDIANLGNTYYRYSMFTGYVSWKNEVHARVARDLKAHVFTALIDSIGAAYRRAQESQVIEQTTQVAEVVVDELALLKAELAAVKADRKSVVEELETVKRDNRDLTQKLGAYQALIEGLKSRTIVVGNVITKVLVSSKVGV